MQSYTTTLIGAVWTTAKFFRKEEPTVAENIATGAIATIIAVNLAPVIVEAIVADTTDATAKVGRLAVLAYNDYMTTKTVEPRVYRSGDMLGTTGLSEFVIIEDYEPAAN
jgi:hypothetical protein